MEESATYQATLDGFVEPISVLSDETRTAIVGVAHLKISLDIFSLRGGRVCSAKTSERSL